ncbi:DUF3857 domain-containing protein [Dysgonomonas sp. OttesenSCG-928-M03]|nr:DUF3857 domain-containing protein [Dysgonomonas sp. OttesenSCG-928-M03]
MNRCIMTLVLACFLIGGNISAQSKFGNVTPDELNMTVYPQDTAAVALVLLKTGDTRFVYNDLSGFQFQYTLQMKVKVLKNEGLEFCNSEISYYQENNTKGEKISGLNGTTYNLENGKIVKTKLSRDLISDENVEGKWKVKKFSLPAAKVGSVIEYQYTITSDYFYDLRDFKFQSSVPVLYTTYKIKIPEYFYYNTNMQGYENIKVKKTPVNETINIRYKDNNGRMRSDNLHCSAEEIIFTGENLPAIKYEPYLWTLNDYINMVSFELKRIQYPWTTIKNFSSTWENIDEELQKLSGFGGNLNKSGLFKEEVSKGELTIEKAKEIQNMIKSRVKWNEKNKLSGSNLKDVLKNGLGSSADMNLLLINALKAGGFDAYPVVLSTRSNGRLPIGHPSVTALNYTITALKLDTLYYFTDASAKYGDWNILPEKCMVNQARLINQNRSSWVDLSTVSSGTNLTNAEVDITDVGVVCKVTNVNRGNSAYSFKSNYYAHKDQQDYIEKLSSKLSGRVENFKIGGLANQDADVRIEYTLVKEGQLGDEFIYLNPMIENPFPENPFKSEQRKFLVNFNYLSSYKQIVNIEIPEGYAIEELPRSAKYVFGDNNAIVFTYRIAQNANNVLLQYQLVFNELMLLPTEYEALKELFAKIALAGSEQVVFKKI